MGRRPGGRLGCGGCVGNGMEAWEAGRRPRGWDGGAAGGVGRKGAIGVRLLLQSPPPAAPPVWSLGAPSAEPSLPALRFLRSALPSLFCSDHTEPGAAAPAAASPAEWEVAPWRGSGLPPRPGGHLSRAFCSAIRLHMCGQPGSLPHPCGSWEGRGLCMWSGQPPWAVGSGLCRWDRTCVPRLRSWELRAGGGRRAAKPPPGAGAVSALHLRAPRMGLWVWSLPCRQGCRIRLGSPGGLGWVPLPAASSQTAVSLPLEWTFLKAGLYPRSDWVAGPRVPRSPCTPPSLRRFLR